MTLDLTEFVEYAAAVTRGQVAGEEPKPESTALDASSSSTLDDPPVPSSPVTYLHDRRNLA